MFCIDINNVGQKLPSEFSTGGRYRNTAYDIRPIVVGRKNWLFCDTQAGANASVIIFTLLETAKANGLNPESYLNHLLKVLPERFAADPRAVTNDLMPWNFEIQRALLPNSSDADH